MEVSISTSTLKSLVARAIKGAAGNVLLPVTELIEVKLEKGCLSLTTTDGTNYLCVSQTGISGDDFAVVLNAEVFSKLISKFTCETVKLNLTDSYVEVIGNGKYKLELILDESGKAIKYPRPDLKFAETVGEKAVRGTVSLSLFKEVLQYARPALAEKVDMQPYTDYFVADCVLATDGNKICKINSTVFKDNKLLSLRLVDLFEAFVDDTIQFAYVNDEIIFISKSATIYGKLSGGVDRYKVSDIKKLTELQFACSGVVNKAELLNALDRVSLFIGKTENNAVKLTFSDMEIGVASLGSSGADYIKFTDTEEKEEFECLISASMLTQIVKSNSSDTVKIAYGGVENAIKIESENVTQIIALIANA